MQTTCARETGTAGTEAQLQHPLRRWEMQAQLVVEALRERPALSRSATKSQQGFRWCNPIRRRPDAGCRSTHRPQTIVCQTDVRVEGE